MAPSEKDEQMEQLAQTGDGHFFQTMGLLCKSHPWHGVELGKDAPDLVMAYVEIVPMDTVKYEVDKKTGYLKVDRPQRYSNICPALYGFLPQTHCTERVAEMCRERTGREDIAGDGDPLDVCILAEKTISHGDILLPAIPIGGLRMIDGDEADDKIIAVMKGDAAYGKWNDIRQCPNMLIDRLRHYFLTYKAAPENTHNSCHITHVYDREEAHEVIRRSQADYRDSFGHLAEMLARMTGRVEG